MNNPVKMLIFGTLCLMAAGGWSQAFTPWAPCRASSELAGANTLLQVLATESTHPMVGYPATPLDPQTPVAAYKVKFFVHRTVPVSPRSELTLEGIARAQWMPAVGGNAYLLAHLDEAGNASQSLFPDEGYYPFGGSENELMEFPLYSGNKVNSTFLWDALSVLMKDKSKAAPLLRKDLRKGELPECIARLYMLQLCPDATEGEGDIVAAVEAAYAAAVADRMNPDRAEEAPLLLDRLLRTAWPLLGDSGKWKIFELCRRDVVAENPIIPPKVMFTPLFETVMARQGPEKEEGIRYLFTGHNKAGDRDISNRRRYLGSVEEIEGILRKTKDPVLDAFLLDLAKNPSAYEGVYGTGELSVVWKILAEHQFPAFKEYLTGIIGAAILPDLAQPPNTTQIKAMAVLAQQLVDAWK